MFVKQVVDELIRAANAAVNTIGTKWDGEYVLGLLPQLKSEAIISAYNGDRHTAGNKMIAPQWVLPYTINIIGNEQNPNVNYVEASMPSFVRINQVTDGVIYMGSASPPYNFYRAFTQTEVSGLLKRGFGKGKEIIWLPVGQKVRFYGNTNLKIVESHIIPVDPFDLPGFNPYTSEYPIDPQVLGIMKDLFIVKARAEMGMTADVVDDKAQTNELTNIKGNIATKT